jgi:predicted ArsR family transcriptional regulator
VKDIQSEVLVHLLRSSRAIDRTIPCIAEAVGCSYTAVKNHLNVMNKHYQIPWVTVRHITAKEAGRGNSRAKVWTLTAKGREVARYRAKTLRRSRW